MEHVKGKEILKAIPAMLIWEFGKEGTKLSMINKLLS